MELLKKITIGGINNIRAGFKGVKETRHVARIYGVCRTVDRKAGTLGEYWDFGGEFRAINEDGEESAAPRVFMPSPADNLLAEAVKANASQSVNFGFDFFVVPREDVAIGYEYKVVPLLDTKPSDALGALAKELPPTKGRIMQPEPSLSPSKPETELTPAHKAKKSQ